MLARLCLLLGFVAGPPLGCGRESGEGPASVAIVEPAHGAEVAVADTAGADVQVRLTAAGITIAPASVREPGTAHHHLFLDLDPTPPGEKIPAGKTGIIHLGKGDSTFVFRGVEPGAHRIIAILADSAHVPLEPAAADTVRFTVGGAGRPE